jgi:Lrp/AsnC family leucine-responsive transcriptional regulator
MPARTINSVDLKIMRELHRDGRISNKELSERVGLSAAQCWQRLKRLQDDGYIAGYSANLDLEKLGYGETVLLEVQMERHDKQSVRAFGEAVANIPEVLEVYLTTGDFDYFIKVAVGGTADYERFLQEKLYQVPGIRHTRSIFALRCLKRETSVDMRNI